MDDAPKDVPSQAICAKDVLPGGRLARVFQVGVQLGIVWIDDRRVSKGKGQSTKSPNVGQSIT